MDKYKPPLEVMHHGVPLISSSYHISYPDAKCLILPYYFEESSNFQLQCIPKEEVKFVRCDKHWAIVKVRGKTYKMTADAISTLKFKPAFKCMKRKG